jgi:hypothetical protein
VFFCHPVLQRFLPGSVLFERFQVVEQGQIMVHKIAGWRHGFKPCSVGDGQRASVSLDGRVNLMVRLAFGKNRDRSGPGVAPFNQRSLNLVRAELIPTTRYVALEKVKHQICYRVRKPHSLRTRPPFVQSLPPGQTTGRQLVGGLLRFWDRNGIPIDPGLLNT